MHEVSDIHFVGFLHIGIIYRKKKQKNTLKLNV